MKSESQVHSPHAPPAVARDGVPRNRFARLFASRQHRLAFGAAVVLVIALALLRIVCVEPAYRLTAWPGIFFGALGMSALTLMSATIIGRAWASLLPTRLQAQARFYVAPVLGLASLTLIAGIFGRLLPMGHPMLLPLVLLLPAAALMRERAAGAALRHGALVAVFGMLCGASILVPLLLFGAYDTNNDAFTYLAHAQWLQQHAFNETLERSALTPLATQVFIYQGGGLRMGSSFLLAMLQAAFRLQWAHTAYPALMVVALTTCCMSAGFAIETVLRRQSRPARLALLALPALTIGGLTFGASRGFAPQTLGLAMAAGLLFLSGPLLRALAGAQSATRMAVRAAWPLAILLASAALTYTELMPFVLLALGASALAIAIGRHAWRPIALTGALTLLFAALLINTDLPREYAALRLQAGVVVGSPVDWSLTGFLAHAFGVHGGAWAGFQWLRASGATAIEVAIGMALLACVLAPIAGALTPLKRAVQTGPLLPAAMLLLTLAVATLYFRYGVASPFAVGTGQSWSQAKLSDWAHPFALALTVFAIAHLSSRAGKAWRAVLPGAVALGLLSSTAFAYLGVWHFARGSYGDVADVGRFYSSLRESVANICGPARPVYLDVSGKTREMMALHLADRKLHANWKDDYYFGDLPEQHSRAGAVAGECVIGMHTKQSGIEPASPASPGGPYRVYIKFDHEPAAIAAVSGAYPRESDQHHWWHWVERTARFDVTQTPRPEPLKLRFDYMPLSDQTLTLQIVRRDGSSQRIMLAGRDRTTRAFETIVEAGSSPLAYFSIGSDGVPSRLGVQDKRMASWMIRDLRLQPEQF